MIKYVQGNLLESDAEALVNTVNEVGIMGKGIALSFKKAFPKNFKNYKKACNQGMVHVGYMFTTLNETELAGPKWIINFPTKRHWKDPSMLQWIVNGLRDLVSVIRAHNIRSIAIPALGCGNGKLDWGVVKPEIELAFKDLPDLDVTVYEPPHKVELFEYKPFTFTWQRPAFMTTDPWSF